MLTTETGFRGPQVCKIVGITYRQLDYWARTGLVTPSVQSAQGSGSQRLYSFEDLVDLKLIKNLLDAGVSLQRVREAIDYLHEIGYELTGVTIASDGDSVYACTSPEEVFDLLKKGQGVFGIAIDPVMRELEGSVSELRTQAEEREQEAPASPVIEIRRGSRGGLNISNEGDNPENLPPSETTNFADNSERQFAKLLDFYQIEWDYEPRSFDIEWDRDGVATQRFTPDFYLSQYNLYIEITTLNQKLVTKKNRKVRRLRELYPDVKCKIFYQRDYLNLLIKYGLEEPSQKALLPESSSPETDEASNFLTSVGEGLKG